MHGRKNYASDAEIPIQKSAEMRYRFITDFRLEITPGYSMVDPMEFQHQT
jgi:hypothetical protein